MEVLIGSILTVAVVLLLTAVVWPAALTRMRELRGAAYMLLLGVPALVVPTDLSAIASLATGSLALFELVLLLGAL